MANKFYITAAIPYVNAKPHIGHALEFVQTDAFARHKKQQGFEVLTLSGGDENALKNVQAAEKAGAAVQEFVDRNTDLFLKLTQKLNCQFDVWQKGSSTDHHKASQKLWELVQNNNPDDIYHKEYEGLYCVGCEAFYTHEELNDKGECYEHPGKPLEKIKEKNYFFRLSRYTKTIQEIIESEKIKIYPEHRKKEILQFVGQGLTDISISRSNARAKNWGVPVPADPTQRMYVWFDALNIYQSGVGFGTDEKKYNKWWPADMHVIGKGIIRFHAIYWPAFLLSAKLALPKAIFVHDYFTVNGQKMSKTLGNVVDPLEIVDKYGVDSLRYYLLAKFSPFNDGDFSEDKLREAHNADLANGLGNLVARIAALCEKSAFDFPVSAPKDDQHVANAMARFRPDEALEIIWGHIKHTDAYLSESTPWKKEGDELLEILSAVVDEIRLIAYLLPPFLPETAEKIQRQFGDRKIKTEASLFPRII